MCGFPKDAAFYWKVWWQRNKPLVHIFPHWNWHGKEGQNVPIWCFSNCDEVELFLNGRSLGKKTMPEFRHLEWNEVVYEPGRLEAKGYINRQFVASKVVETVGVPTAIKLMPDRMSLVADGQDVVPIAVAVVDSNERVVPTADNKIFLKSPVPDRTPGLAMAIQVATSLIKPTTAVPSTGIAWCLPVPPKEREPYV